MRMSEEYEVEAIGVEVDAQPIELYKVLKIANAVSGGGEAKFAISEGYVAVNGELEQRKRRKVYDGDVIEFNNEFYLVLCDQPVTEPSEAPAKEKKAKEKPVKEKQPAASNKSQPAGGKAKKAGGQSAGQNKPRKGAKNSAGNKGKAGQKGGAKPASKNAQKASQKADQNTGRKPISF